MLNTDHVVSCSSGFWRDPWDHAGWLHTRPTRRLQPAAILGSWGLDGWLRIQLCYIHLARLSLVVFLFSSYFNSMLHLSWLIDSSENNPKALSIMPFSESYMNELIVLWGFFEFKKAGSTDSGWWLKSFYLSFRSRDYLFVKKKPLWKILLFHSLLFGIELKLYFFLYFHLIYLTMNRYYLSACWHGTVETLC